MKVYFILGILFCSIGSYAQDIGRQILERELDRNHYDEVLRGVDSLYRIEGGLPLLFGVVGAGFFRSGCPSCFGAGSSLGGADDESGRYL